LTSTHDAERQEEKECVFRYALKSRVDRVD
jgi:hypothetical protein